MSTNSAPGLTLFGIIILIPVDKKNCQWTRSREAVKGVTNGRSPDSDIPQSLRPFIENGEQSAKSPSAEPLPPFSRPNHEASTFGTGDKGFEMAGRASELLV